MAAEPRHKSRKHPIEPLNWAEAAQSPALKGMLSFLDVSAADIRNSQNQNPDLYSIRTDDGLPPQDTESIPGSETVPVSESVPVGESVRTLSGMRTVQEHESGPEPKSDIASKSLFISVAPPKREALIVSDGLPVSEALIGSRFNKDGMVIGAVSSQNRKIRKCRLVQDAHSAGEELLYRILWEEAKLDQMNPVGSRTLRMGYAEIAARARMHKTNVRLNLANLIAKLAVVVLEEHNSTDLIPRLYRIYSPREILDRRKAAGLEYVIRQKNVIFVTPDGTPIPLGNTSSGKVKRKLGSCKKGEFQAGSDTLTGCDMLTGDWLSSVDALDSEPEQLNLDVRRVSEALNKYWSTDEAAAHQLVRECRRVRPDAQGDEIAFFVEEKAEIAKANRNITNPTGLIIATVPQCFTGSTFEAFRRRRNEQLQIAAEEDARRLLQESEMEVWMSREVERLEKIIRDPNIGDQEKTKAELRLLNFR